MRIFLLLTALFPVLLAAVTHTVDAGGGADYEIIQDAIAASSDGDSIVVFPGTYPGVVDFTGKSLNIMSLAITTGDTAYVRQTVIDGQWETGGVRIEGCEQSFLGGFSIHRCIAQYYESWMEYLGAGIYVLDSRSTIKRCRIYDNYCNASGGGISVYEAECTLIGNEIFENMAFGGGGISISQNPNFTPPIETRVVFDTEELNSIFCNMASRGSDITVSCTDSVEIFLNEFTTVEPDSFFVNTYRCSLDRFTYNETLIEPVEADLYVSAAGNNGNSGLTPDDPLRSVSFAMMKIRTDSLHPRTVHVADGYYSHSVTGELFPVHLRKDVDLSGGEDTTFDGEGLFPFFNHRETGSDWALYYRSGSIAVENFRLINGVPYTFGSVLDLYDLENATVRNITIEDVVLPEGYHEKPALVSISCVDHIRVSNVRTSEYYSGGVSCGTFADAYLDRVHTPDGVIGIYISLNHFVNPSYVRLSNCLSTGNEFFGSWPGGIFASGLKLYGPHYFVDPDSTVIDVINCTFADNAAEDAAVLVDDRITVNFYNCIFYGNEPNDIILNGQYNEGSVTFTHCLIENGEDDVLLYGEGYSLEIAYLLTDDPGFLGTGATPYELAQGSQCINAGTTDIPGFDFEPGAIDLAGNPRVYDGQVDLGCYEYQSESTEDLIENPSHQFKAYPNPFNPETTISFSVRPNDQATLAIYNLKGQRVKSCGKFQTGKHKIVWDGTNDALKPVASGVYLCRLKSNTETKTRKLMLLQ